MKKTWIIGAIAVGCFAGASLGACGSSNATTTSTSGSGAASAAGSGTTTTSSTTTSGATTSSAASSGGGSTAVTSGTTSSSAAGSTSSSGGPDAGEATTTIAAARMANVTTPITVAAVVTAIQGPSGDEVNYYIEDLAGGVYSGVDVYCDPAPNETKCPAGPKAGNPSIGDYVLLTGSLVSYNGQTEFEPTVYALLEANHALPAAMPVTGADVAASNTSAQYRGVLVKLSETLTVTNPTPAALYNTSCGAVDAGMPECTTHLCAPPTYSGFQMADSANNVIYEEQYLFPGDELQSSPECVSMKNQEPVTQGETFTFMEGILDYDGFAGAQFLAPRNGADYSIGDGGM